jgi:hypothetical protein
VILRASEARSLPAWVQANPFTWRPSAAPFQKERKKGFDKMLGYWALARWPKSPTHLVSRPFLVRHIGDHSSLHARGVRNDAAFHPAGYQVSA